MTDTRALVDALRELLACNEESAGWSMSMVADRAAFESMLERSEARLSAAKEAAQRALAAAEQPAPAATVREPTAAEIARFCRQHRGDLPEYAALAEAAAPQEQPR